ncbi:MAG TPA: DUF4279 domain-containing protein [Gammaproteobacteria bacterium]|nr:DUF4279 domain-containing protein [Gammaproteobacteria bacterium]
MRIKHPALDPDEITRALGINPEETISKGESVSRGVRRVHTESYWLAELSFPSKDEIVAEAVRAASQGLSFDVDTPKLRKLSAGLPDFTSPKLSSLRERAGQRFDPNPAGDEIGAAFELGPNTVSQEFALLARLRKLKSHQAFFGRIRAEGGTVSLLLQRTHHDAPFTLTSELAHRLADLDIDLEID